MIFNGLIIVALLFNTSIVIAKAQTIEAIVGWSKPPYVIESENAGFELELIQAIFKQGNINVQFSYVPHGRLMDMLMQGSADIALTLNPRQKPVNITLSQPYIRYQNAAISLKGRQIALEKIADIGKHSVVAFQNAAKVLGTEYNEAVSNNLHYLEVPLQSRQVELLIYGRTDIVVLDVNIFYYLSEKIRGQDFMDYVNVHYLFPATPYHIGCISELICEQFNQQYRTFVKSKEYQQLIKKYRFIER